MLDVWCWPIPEMTAGGRGVRLLRCTRRGDPEAIKQAKADAIMAGYSAEAVGHIGRTPSDVFLFSKLPEADQQAILRQANGQEFEPYIAHAHMKLRGPMRQERAGKQTEAPAPPPSAELGVRTKTHGASTAEHGAPTITAGASAGTGMAAGAHVQ